MDGIQQKPEWETGTIQCSLYKSADCMDNISTKKCKKLKKKGKCKDKKIWKKCMETCQKCTPGTIDYFSNRLKC